MSAPQIVLDLAARFEANYKSYTGGHYNETQARREFIDPLFRALGWDVDNEKGYAEAYKEVVHEDAVKVGGATKAPDYSFRIGGVRKFFLEAKKPGVNLKDDPSPAFQLRRYAWSAKLPLSILTDFQEFAAYDTRIKPAATDKASVGRVMYLTCEQYEARWDDIAGVFAREAVLKGSFDRYVESEKKKKGTAEVDRAFLAEIESWRELLAKNLALRNPGLSPRDLNYAVQVTIDRTIFLRIAEDRGLERYGRLLALVNGERIYQRMFRLFEEADDRYNSGLFYFREEPGRPGPDAVTPGLELDDAPLRKIIKGLYYPESPYEFSVLPAEILGQVYEQFLGKVIRLTAGHRAVVEDKPEVKKAGGVYYTPSYIVDYIVERTVGKLCAAEHSAGVPPAELKTGSAGVPPAEDGNSAEGSAGVPPAEEGKIRRRDAGATIKIRSRGYLPHWEAEDATYFVTFRLYDSLPDQVLDRLQQEREVYKRAAAAGVKTSLLDERRSREIFTEKIEEYLDAGEGSCLLANENAARIVADALLHFHGVRYLLAAWVVMPNHVHAVFKTLGETKLADVLHSWKSFTAKEINQALQRKGPVWQREYYDHLVRDERDLQRVVKYVEDNPAKPGRPNWPYRSAGVPPDELKTGPAGESTQRLRT